MPHSNQPTPKPFLVDQDTTVGDILNHILPDFTDRPAPVNDDDADTSEQRYAVHPALIELISGARTDLQRIAREVTYKVNRLEFIISQLKPE